MGQFFLWKEPVGLEHLVINSCVVGGLVAAKK